MRSNAASLAGRPRERSGTSYTLGIVHYRAYADLERCLRSVKAQSLPPESILVVDNDPLPEELDVARKQHPDVTWMPQGNTGFAPAANSILKLASRLESPIGFCLILNPDVELEPDFAENLSV
jgi:GT2 family glycosyltransferase